MRDIVLIQIGDIGNVTALFQAIKEALENSFPLKCSFGEKIALPIKAWNSIRFQYRAEDFLLVPKKKGGMALAIADVDIYSGRLNFVFGLASSMEKSAVISLYRLHPEFYGKQDGDLCLKRARKEAVHEVGHLFSLGHCPSLSCVMSFSNSIMDVDRKEERLCKRCKGILERKQDRR